MAKAIALLTFCVSSLLLGTPQLLAQTGSLDASPDPCTIYHTQALCATTLSWTSRGTTAVQVWVSVDGGVETLFASGGSSRKSMSAEWIQAMKSYVFKFYDYSSGSRGSLLASRRVTAVTSIRCPP